MSDSKTINPELIEENQKNLTRKKASGDIVHVGCKLPNGLLLQVGNEAVELAGANSSEIVGGFGITAVSKDFWEAWKAEHAGYEPLKRDLIFVQGKEADARAEAKEKKGVKGIEGVNADKPAVGVKKADDKG
jgi:hypothetical protein